MGVIHPSSIVWRLAVPGLHAALSESKCSVRRTHTHRKQDLAMSWGCFSRCSGGVSPVPTQPSPWSGSVKVCFCELVVFIPSLGFPVPWAQDALGSWSLRTRAGKLQVCSFKEPQSSPNSFAASCHGLDCIHLLQRLEPLSLTCCALNSEHSRGQQRCRAIFTN